MKQINVIYIDDEPMLCDIFTRLFNGNGVLLKAFSDHKLALEEISRSEPDLMFIDYRLDGITGEQVANMINPIIPKVLITGELDIQCSYPFFKILPKPTMPEEIQAVIQSCRSLKA